jgi:hypothetical protein
MGCGECAALTTSQEVGKKTCFLRSPAKGVEMAQKGTSRCTRRLFAHLSNSRQDRSGLGIKSRAEATVFDPVLFEGVTGCVQASFGAIQNHLSVGSHPDFVY